jgi:hypothetical protein
MGKYSKDDVINKIKDQIKLNNPQNIYQNAAVNYSGTTSDTNELYTEVLAKELLYNLRELDSIQVVNRDQSYKIADHSNVKINQESNRVEENIAKAMNTLSFDTLGKILDFQVPLKGKQNDHNVGKIDLISYKEDEDPKMFLIELKVFGNNETLLRAILEIYTNYKQVDTDKLLSDFNLPAGTPVIPAVVCTPECRCYEDKGELDLGSRPMLQALALALGVELFELDFSCY